MKHLFMMSVLLAAALGIGCTGQRSSPEAVSEGAAMGYRGIIRVQVGTEKGVISEITVIESREDSAVGGTAIDELTDMVLMYNTAELDAISGATETSKGFLAAVENAIMGP
jgi:uncharacterized protein with FMN-binding domain